MIRGVSCLTTMSDLMVIIVPMKMATMMMLLMLMLILAKLLLAMSMVVVTALEEVPLSVLLAMVTRTGMMALMVSVTEMMIFVK